MIFEVFVAYASGNKYHNQIIKGAAERASNGSRRILPWSRQDTSGYPISLSVEEWIQRADALVGDVSVVNDNVTFEIGYAIGLGKPVRLIRSEQISFEDTKKIGLLDTLGHDTYGMEASLAAIFGKGKQEFKWPDIAKNRDQPIFILQPPNPTDWSLRLTSAVKKTARLRFRSFNPWEISRLNASEAYEQVTSSYGVVAFWMEGTGEIVQRNNQRAALIYGIAKGRSIPALLIAKDGERLPLDLQDQAIRWREFSDFEGIIRVFRDDVADLQLDFVEPKGNAQNILEQVNCGDPTAENEATALSEYFLETEAYQRALNGDANVLVGRKGSGKTAIFLQVRDRTRADKDNIIIDLIPEGHQLIKMKEFILDQLTLGARKEVISAFWQYVLWLEIAHKLLEKDSQRAYRDPQLLKKFNELKDLFENRVDTGAGDFSERLRLLSENIMKRFSDAGVDRKTLDASNIISIVYGEDIHKLREAVSNYLQLKGFVFFLLDNLDRFWTPGGFTADDALIVVGLIEAMQDITRRLRRRRLDFRWAIFVRSDVYEFLIRGMADYSKLAVQSLEWSDPEMLKAMFERRVLAGVPRESGGWNAIWTAISAQSVDGVTTLDFLVDGSLMRPRYLIRLFETARRRTLAFNRQKISEDDYRAALKELGWQVMEDLDREVADLVPNGTDLLFNIIQSSHDLTPDKFRYLVGANLQGEAVEKLIDVMIWNGSLGISEGTDCKYIFNCGYKRQYIAAAIRANKDIKLVIHPTLLSAVA